MAANRSASRKQFLDQATKMIGEQEPDHPISGFLNGAFECLLDVLGHAIRLLDHDKLAPGVLLFSKSGVFKDGLNV